MYGDLDSTSRQRMDQRGWGRLMGDIPSQTQQENSFATEPLQEDDAPEDDDFYVDEQGNIAHLAPIRVVYSPPHIPSGSDQILS